MTANQFNWLPLWIAAILCFGNALAVALPRRLVILLDGISYRDMQALQHGIYVNRGGKSIYRRAFDEGYFPVSRNISTYPSASDVAWSTILGTKPLPGYQRTYYSIAANTMLHANGVTSSVEFEKQMTWRLESGFRRAMSYLCPLWTYRYEVQHSLESFLSSKQQGGSYYLYIYSTDAAQHMNRDVFEMLSFFDQRLNLVRAEYKRREGRDLEILIVSDHGNDRAMPSKRVLVRSSLIKNGYHISTAINHPKDVILPTVGIESWVEVHNAMSETDRLLELLCTMPGADIVTAKVADAPNRFIVVNSACERAVIDFDPSKERFRYSPVTGDPLVYLPIVKVLQSKQCLDERGFASADDWMRESIDHEYPLALERIVYGHTTVALNPATILVSLKPGYVHADALLMDGSELVRLGGTHGSLDGLASTGIVLSNFTRTTDTSATRIAPLFGGFDGMRDYRASESGAELFSVAVQQQIRVRRTPWDGDCGNLPKDQVMVRVWSPVLKDMEPNTIVHLRLRQVRKYPAPRIRRSDVESEVIETDLIPCAWNLPSGQPYERLYSFPASLHLSPRVEYKVSGFVPKSESSALFSIALATDATGAPVAY